MFTFIIIAVAFVAFAALSFYCLILRQDVEIYKELYDEELSNWLRVSAKYQQLLKEHQELLEESTTFVSKLTDAVVENARLKDILEDLSDVPFDEWYEAVTRD